MKKQSVERRELQLHRNILKDIVFKQAGTREKAILESVMNAVDSGSTRIDITLSETQLVVQDDGRGFKTRAEIVANFETFGTPHEEGDAVFGRFRMGRGQLFAQGQNAWRSNQFLLKVDAKEELAYDLHDNHPLVPGCRIEVEWYESLLPTERQEILRELERMIKYVQIPVTLNGRLVNTLPATAKWDHETPDGWFKFTATGVLVVYNLGVWVCSYPADKFGLAGVVVSKVQLDVNFARNEPMADGKVWQRLMRVLKKRAAEGMDAKVARRLDLTDAERDRACRALMAGDLPAEHVVSLKLFTDVTGQDQSLRSISRWFSKAKVGAFASAPQRDRRGDRVMGSQVAFVFAEETWERFGVEGFFDVLDVLTSDWRLTFERRPRNYPFHQQYEAVRWRGFGWVPLVEVPFETLAQGMNTTNTLLPDSELWPNAKIAIEVLESASRALRSNGNRGRKLRIGKSDTADGWTDGRSYIAINERFVRNGLDMTLSDWGALGHLLLHEYLHSDSTEQGDMVHSPDFFLRFHEESRTRLGTFIQHALTKYQQVLEREGKTMSRYLGRMADKQVKIASASKKLQAAVEVAARSK